MPTDHDDDDHDKNEQAVIGTTSIAIVSQTSLGPVPTDHPERPQKKPFESSVSTVSGGTVATALATFTASTATSSTFSTATTVANTTSTSSAAPTFLLPSIFPTFGVSPRTQIWIYGAVTTILIFCVALGAFFCVLRRRR